MIELFVFRLLYKPSPSRVVVTALEIVPAGFGVEAAFLFSPLFYHPMFFCQAFLGIFVHFAEKISKRKRSFAIKQSSFIYFRLQLRSGKLDFAFGGIGYNKSLSAGYSDSLFYRHTLAGYEVYKLILTKTLEIKLKILCRSIVKLNRFE